jgi:hypothetical protein
MSERERRGEKRKSEIALDEERAKANVEKIKWHEERYKKLHAEVCKKACEVNALNVKVRDLEYTNRYLVTVGQALARRIVVLETNLE